MKALIITCVFLFAPLFAFVLLDRPTLNRALPQKETLSLDKSVALHCAALSGFPTPRVTLFNGSKILASNLSDVSYTITLSSAADFKKYLCEATNLVGSDRINITVNLAGELYLNSTNIMSCYLIYPTLHQSRSPSQTP